jgi:membrane protein implicated in regulation of membrane protease activity
MQATGQRMSLLMRTIATIVVSLTLALILSWQLALVAFCFAPFMLISGVVRMRSRYGKKTAKDEASSVQRSGKVCPHCCCYCCCY